MIWFNISTSFGANCVSYSRIVSSRTDFLNSYFVALGNTQRSSSNNCVFTTGTSPPFCPRICARAVVLASMIDRYLLLDNVYSLAFRPHTLSTTYFFTS